MKLGPAIIFCAVIAAVTALILSGHGYALLIGAAAVGVGAIFLMLLAALS